MKRFRRYILTSVLTLSLLIGMIPSSLAAGWPPKEPDFSVENGGAQLYFNIIDSDIATVELVIPNDAQDASSYSGSITVPAKVSNGDVEYSVTAIGDRAFRNSDVTSLKLPESITSIGGSAFEGCASLTTLVLPDSVTEIGGSAFRNCSALTSISVPSGVKTLYSATFSGCKALTTVTLSEGLETIESQVFMSCQSLENLDIPNTVTEIGGNAFSGCSAAVTIPVGVTSGLKEALVAHGNVNAVTIAEGSPYALENGVLYNGTTLEGAIDVNVTEVVVRDGTTAIADDAFAQQTSSLEKITFPDTLVSIGENAFKGCTELATADLPANLKSIGASAFEGCESLKNVVVPIGVTEIPEMAFCGCLSIERVVLPEGLTKIGDYAFDLTVYEGNDPVNNDPKLESINIPSTVTNVGENFLGGVKVNGGTALIFEGTTPPTFATNALAGISGDDANKPVVYYPAGAENAYTAENNALVTGGLVSKPGEGTTPDNQYALSIAEDTTSVKVGRTVQLTVTRTVPTGATLEWSSSNNQVATVSDGTITGVKAGSATITASIKLNGITLTSDSCSVTVSEESSGGGDSDPTYSITLPKNVTGGSVMTNRRYAERGDTVTLTVVPDKGYELDELVVTDRKGNELDLTEKADNKFTFKMPGSKVTVETSFKLIETEPENPFTDVSKNDYFYDAVLWAADKGITSGVTDTLFAPNASCTRAQMVTFLWRANGSPKATGSNPFTDVSADAYYYDAVLWAVKEGITSGTSATTFSPDTTVTRGQTVTFLYRTAGSPAVSGGSFADVAGDAYYADAVAWAVKEGITSGTGGNNFSPDAPCTRGQIVTFLYRDAR